MQITIILFLSAILSQPGLAQANYYQGKTVTILSGTTAGSAYDTTRVSSPRTSANTFGLDG